MLKNVVSYSSVKKRGVAQLVERVVWDHEVARSIRVTPTKALEYQGFE